MAGVILENISTKKLVLICLFLFSLSLASFILGGAKVPRAVHTQTVGGNWCVDRTRVKGKWYPSRGENKCSQLSDEEYDLVETKDVVFSFQYPLPRENLNLTMSKWFMYHVTVLSVNINYQEGNNPEKGAKMDLEVKVGYKDGNDWKALIDDSVVRSLDCDPPEKKETGNRWNCDFLDLFEIGNMQHDEYLVNIRLPVNPLTGSNVKIGQIDSLELVWFAQTGGFTLYFLVMKTVCFAMLLPLTFWNWKRVADLHRSPVFLERLLLGLAVSALVLNFPIDWLVLVIEMKFMLLWSDIRQGVFLSILLAYWLVFTGEHTVDDVKRGVWGSYWKQLATVILASSLMFIFDMCERGVRIANPLFSLWSTTQGAMLGKAFIGIAIAASIIYFLILLGFVIKASVNIWKKKAQFKTMAKSLRVHYMSIIYRFYFTLAFTAVCSLLTIIAFAMGQVYESEWKWDFDETEFGEDGDVDIVDETSYIQRSMKGFEINTAFQLGVYVTWNVYVMAMLIFYAPSHKSPALNIAVVADGDDNDERVELTAMSSDVRSRPHTSRTASLEQTDETDETVNLTTGHNVMTDGVAQIHTLANTPLVD